MLCIHTNSKIYYKFTAIKDEAHHSAKDNKVYHIPSCKFYLPIDSHRMLLLIWAKFLYEKPTYNNEYSSDMNFG